MLNLLFPFIISLATFYAGSLCIECKPHLLKHKNKIFSFTTGIALTYLILILIPKIYTTTSVAIYVLLGFSFFLMMHTHLAVKDLKKTHRWFSLIYHLFLGIILLNITATNFFEGLLLFVPLLLMTMISKINAHHVHHIGRYTTNKTMWSYILALAPIVGAAIAYFYPINETIISALTGIVGGIILFTVIRELLPDAEELHVAWFLIGEGVFLICILLASSFH